MLCDNWRMREWTKAIDDLLVKAMERHGDKSYAALAAATKVSKTTWQGLRTGTTIEMSTKTTKAFLKYVGITEQDLLNISTGGQVSDIKANEALDKLTTEERELLEWFPTAKPEYRQTLMLVYKGLRLQEGK